MTVHFSRWKKAAATASLPLLLGASSVALSACQGEDEGIVEENGGVVEDETEDELFEEESPSPSPTV